MNNEWQPIETAPDCDETNVLLYDSKNGETLVGKKLYKNKITKYLNFFGTEEELKYYKTKYISGEIYFNPTHWQPLPKPPQQ